MSKKPPSGNRPGTRKAKELLAEVAKAYNVDVKSLKDKSHLRCFMAARRKYCILGLQRGIGLGALADVLCRDRTTVAYHQRPEMRMRKISQRLVWERKRVKRSRARAVSRGIRSGQIDVVTTLDRIMEKSVAICVKVPVASAPEYCQHEVDE